MSRVGRTVRPWLIAACVAATDQAAKVLVERNVPAGDRIAVIGGVAHIVNVRNLGSAFGIFGAATVPVLVSVVVISLWAVASATGRIRRLGMAFEAGASMMVGGALGNLLDRIRLGSIVDFIDFRFWPVFNLADAAIVVGALVAVYSMVPGRTGGRSSE